MNVAEKWLTDGRRDVQDRRTKKVKHGVVIGYPPVAVDAIGNLPPLDPNRDTSKDTRRGMTREDPCKLEKVLKFELSPEDAPKKSIDLEVWHKHINFLGKKSLTKPNVFLGRVRVKVEEIWSCIAPKQGKQRKDGSYPLSKGGKWNEGLTEWTALSEIENLPPPVTVYDTTAVESKDDLAKVQLTEADECGRANLAETICEKARDGKIKMDEDTGVPVQDEEVGSSRFVF